MDMDFFDEAMKATGLNPIYIGFDEQHNNMKTYTIHRTGREKELGEVTVIVSNKTGDNATNYELTPEASLNIRNHSPTGFEFGYGGSGPTQLALAIMLDYFGEGPSLALYHAFKWRFIAPLKHPGGTITAAEIEEWKAQFDEGNAHE